MSLIWNQIPVLYSGQLNGKMGNIKLLNQSEFYLSFNHVYRKRQEHNCARNGQRVRFHRRRRHVAGIASSISCITNALQVALLGM